VCTLYEIYDYVCAGAAPPKVRHESVSGNVDTYRLQIDTCSQDSLHLHLLFWQSFTTLARLNAEIKCCVGEADFLLAKDGKSESVYLLGDTIG
jgi:hypothetical protein